MCNIFTFCCGITFGSIVYIILIIIWYKYEPTNENTHSYFNPFIFIILIVAISFGYFVMENLYTISHNIRVKQGQSIKDKISDLYLMNYSLAISEEYIKRLTLMAKMYNIINFINCKNDLSLIVPKRDL